MFTGLVVSIGTIESITATEAGLELYVQCTYSDLVDGESISMNGICLTVRTSTAGGFTVAAMIMTVGRTTIGDWKTGQRINLERAMTPDMRLGGHIVQGHVDGVGTVESVTRVEDTVLVDIALTPGLSEMLVLHGSVAVDGVSLTVNALQGDNLQVALIEYTLRHTSLGDMGTGSRVNVETDVIGKYVQRLVAPYLNR